MVRRVYQARLFWHWKGIGAVVNVDASQATSGINEDGELDRAAATCMKHELED